MTNKPTNPTPGRLKRYEAALRSIAANTCCDSCQEAALVARKALAEPEPGKERTGAEPPCAICRRDANHPIHCGKSEGHRYEPQASPAASPQRELLQEACAEVYLHGKYQWLTQQMRTVVKEAFADAIDTHFAKDPSSELKVDRWWRAEGVASPAEKREPGHDESHWRNNSERVRPPRETDIQWPSNPGGEPTPENRTDIPHSIGLVGYDGSPQEEVKRLRHQLKTLKESTQLTMVMRLRNQYDEQVKRAESAEQAAAQARKERDELQPWLRHFDDCAFLVRTKETRDEDGESWYQVIPEAQRAPCSCGLAAAIEKQGGKQ